MVFFSLLSLHTRSTWYSFLCCPCILWTHRVKVAYSLANSTIFMHPWWTHLVNSYMEESAVDGTISSENNERVSNMTKWNALPNSY
jgi:hypothetical protein